MDTSIDLHQALPLFLLRCDAESTKVAYERELRRFLAWLPAPEVGSCERYVAHLRERGLSPTTVRWRATVAAKFLSTPSTGGYPRSTRCSTTCPVSVRMKSKRPIVSVYSPSHELDTQRVNRVEDIVREGDRIQVKVLSVDPEGKVRLSRKALLVNR